MGLPSKTYTIKNRATETALTSKAAVVTLPDDVSISVGAEQGAASLGTVFLAKGPDGALIPMRISHLEGTTVVLARV